MMHAKGIFTLIVLFHFSLVLVIHCEQCNTADCSTTPTPVPEKTSIEKSMDTFFKMMNSFLEIVIKNTVFSPDSEFNLKTLRELMNSTKGYEEILKSSWQGLLHAYGPYYACIFIGLLMPIFCCCYKCCFCSCCCCCCCSKKKDDRDPKNAKCKRMTLSLILTACTTMMLLGTIIACLSAQLLHSATSNTDNGFVGRFDANVQKLKMFTINTVQDVPKEANETVTLSLLAVEKDIEGFVDRVAGTVMGKINATSLLDQAEVLGNASRAAFDDLQNVTKSLEALVKFQRNITGELDSIRKDIVLICANIPVPHACDTSGLELKVNFSGLDNLKNQMNQVRDAQNISQAVADVRKQFVNMNQDSLAKVRKDMDGSLDQVKSIRTQVQAKLKNISTIADPVIDFLDSSLQRTNWSKDLINKIGTYIWYGTTSLSCLLMLTVLLYYIGILLGLCGKRPSDDGSSCKKGTGAFCIVCGNSWAMSFYWLLMLVVILLFSIGGPLYAMGCRFLNGGVEGVKTFDSLFTDLLPWRLGSSLQNISSALENCKENKGLYTAIYLIDKSINLEDLINMTEINIKVREVANKDFLISHTNFLTPQLVWQLNNFTVLNSINFREFLNQTDLNNVTGTDLGKLATSLNETAGQIETTVNSSTANSLRHQSYRLVLLMDNDIPKFTVAKDSLGRSIKSLQEKSNLATQTHDLINGMQHAQENLTLNIIPIMKQALNETANTVLSNISRIFNDILNKLKNDLGKCRPAYDAIQGISDSVCITVLNPFNGFWFGLGCTLFFFIPSTIFGDILNWLLRKKRPYKKKETDDSSDCDSHSRDFQDKVSERHGPSAYSGHVQDNIPLRHGPVAYSGHVQDNIPLRHGPVAYSGHVQDNIPLRHGPVAYSEHVQDNIPLRHGPVAYSGHVQDNIPLRHYPQGAMSSVYHNPGFEPDINRQFSPAGRPIQHEQYVDYREMASNNAVIHPDYTPGPGKLYT